ncbi:WbqC family protein [Marinobacterium stanieri]|uniref:WbqC-like protein family protein n=1 Tax=Marinobacterium stanieri TaxID=49186 RepID=A0A1N6X240_9GAMM|nr:WbqC family protein [Marinobacterium stanieri]SIQ96359.1 WbqC-like protein family protein [Marinobacterium stanieri]
MKRVAISQSNYIPWKGYFDLINSVDVFVLYDDVQYTRRDWRNRNKVKTSTGVKWLTIPVDVKGKYLQKINETQVSDPLWNIRHWEEIKRLYGKTPYFSLYAEQFEMFYLSCGHKYLSDINKEAISLINRILGIGTTILNSSDFVMEQGRTERLLDICKQVGGTAYLSGPTAQAYFDEGLAQSMGVTVEWMDYGGYPEYPQLYPPFEHGVTILDLLFNTGPDARRYMKSFSE